MSNQLEMFENVNYKPVELLPKKELKDMSFNFLIPIVTSLFSQIFSIVSPEIRQAIDEFVKNLYLKAKATPNAFDDHAVEILAVVLGVKLED